MNEEIKAALNQNNHSLFAPEQGCKTPLSHQDGHVKRESSVRREKGLANLDGGSSLHAGTPGGAGGTKEKTPGEESSVGGPMMPSEPEKPSVAPIWIQELCEEKNIRRSSAMRFFKAKRHKLKATKAVLPSGQHGIFVDRQAFEEKVRSGRRYLPKSSRFFLNCINAGANPFRVLFGCLSLNSSTQEDVEFYDADLAHAVIKLTLDPDPSFLEILTGQRPPDNSFAAEIAGLHQPAECFLLGKDDDFLEREFITFWNACRRAVRYGNRNNCCVIDDKHILSELSVKRDLLRGTRPLYLDRLASKDVPEWAMQSVVPFRDDPLSLTAKALRRMTKLALRRPKLAQVLEIIKKSIVELVPTPRLKGEKAFGKDSGVQQLIQDSCHRLTKFYRVDANLAWHYCWAVFNRYHHDVLVVDRERCERLSGHKQHVQLQDYNRSVADAEFDGMEEAQDQVSGSIDKPLKNKKGYRKARFSVAAVNRIFCMSRAVKC